MMARLMLSAGMFSSLASDTAFLSLGLPSTSPPPIRAAIVISLMTFVNMRPRLASMAPFLCLILCHLEWPDIDFSPLNPIPVKFSRPEWKWGDSGNREPNSGLLGRGSRCFAGYRERQDVARMNIQSLDCAGRKLKLVSIG